MRAHAYSKILSEVPLRQPEHGQYRPKHVVHYIVIKYTSCDTVVFDYTPFPMMSISLVQDRDQCGAAVNTVMYLRFSQNVSFLTSRKTISLS